MRAQRVHTASHRAGTDRRLAWSVALVACALATASLVGVPTAAFAADTTSPITVEEPHRAAFIGPATILLHATDTGGSGVATTYYFIDGGPAQVGTVIHERRVGPHWARWWSVDFAGNVEDTRCATVPGQGGTWFQVLPQSIKPIYTSTSIHVSASTVSIGRTFTLSGAVSPGKYHDRVRVQVLKPGASRWLTSSTRLTYNSAGAWSYRYWANRSGSWRFRAVFDGAPPYFADQPGRWKSTSRTISAWAR